MDKLTNDGRDIFIKIISAIIHPRRWRIMYEQLLLFLKNVIKYRNFSLNLNSKRYGDKKLSALTIRGETKIIILF